MLTVRGTTPTPTIKPNLTNPPPPAARRRLAGEKSCGAGGSLRTKMGRRSGRVRAVISSGDRTAESPAPAPRVPGMDGYDGRESGQTSGGVKVTATVLVRTKIREKLLDKFEGLQRSFTNAIGKGISLELISEEIDPQFKAGKSVEAYVRDWAPTPTEQPYVVQYSADFIIPRDFGNPGAILVTNYHSKEFYLVEIVLSDINGGPFYFFANSWIQSRNDNPDSRIIFRNQAYLPSQTPPGIKDLRHEDLRSLRGNGKGERKMHERIYDYDSYNDLGNVEKNKDFERPVLAGKERPYPRRCRSGRPPMKSDRQYESRIEKPHPVYVPRDEAFEEIKMATFSAGRLKAVLHNLIPQINASLSSSDVPFNCFSDIDKLYNDGFVIRDEEEVKTNFLQAISKRVFTVGDRLFKYEIPASIRSDRFAWLRDNEFARQAVAGLNPVTIELLKEFPIVGKLDPTVYGSQLSAITKEVLEEELNGMSLEKAIENKRLFMMDYHDLLLPFVDKINSIEGRRCYASRTIFYLNNSEVLNPIAIELSLPPTDSSPGFKRVYTHGHDATGYWLWKLAKAHVCAVDAGVHQLVNHWLRTHACMEPYIIATNRQLSSMHPIYKLLHPHMRYTMEINALARQSLINGGGIIEACFTPGRLAQPPTRACGDYPYAADGLLVWSAIKEYVESYVSHFYSDPKSVASDIELQEWWKEIKNKGHPDKKNEPWWPKLNTKEDLAGIVTIMIWISSGQHAAINFGQYPFGGYVPNRPTLMRKLIPQENEPEYKKFLMNPQLTFLSALPTQLQATKVMAVQETLSTHSADEDYLGQENPLHRHWTSDHQVQKIFKRFSSKVEEIEGIINERNHDFRNKNRCGAGVPPYELLMPTSEAGVTGRGIPNSISI
ncbi:hypothetical protein V2J09_003885 [Rumex salicifolius]